MLSKLFKSIKRFRLWQKPHHLLLIEERTIGNCSLVPAHWRNCFRYSFTGHRSEQTNRGGIYNCLNLPQVSVRINNSLFQWKLMFTKSVSLVHYSYGAKACVIWKHLTLTLSYGKPLPKNKCYKNSKEGKLLSVTEMIFQKEPERKPVVRRILQIYNRNLSLYSRDVEENGNPGLISAVTQDDVFPKPLMALL